MIIKFVLDKMHFRHLVEFAPSGSAYADSRACVDESFYKVKSRDAVKSGIVGCMPNDLVLSE